MVDVETIWAHRLREAGLRVTRPRLSVLSVLADRPHADADAIVTGARGLHPSLSPQAVYGVLKALVAAGIARRIAPAGAPALFELRVGDNHHHLVCRSCGAVADVDCVLGAAPCLAPSDPAGFVVDEAEVVFWGLCRACQNRGRQVADAADPVQLEEHGTRGGAGA
ncbi:transcriptional repressor [Blastococcus sp. MG754426]|uniref:Fur family transcriptional regulator n=1 Tax=unclassified Blastococcus TaxID=2619396 RepID=UPI001EF1584D|nr:MULTISPECIES: Fur family transcriptional regulator [unclassified Blastococcus]MCF6508317.1 transcriptional repressor [Blastococcus sp. MG754426]MCF6512964.1 transcriptional repressor [Blastococcus sp. MG754427]